MAGRPKVIVLDDDPTGCQTVHSCPLLLRWDVSTLAAALADPAPIFFVLTNTRAMSPAAAAEVTREACRNLKAALEVSPVSHWALVSRSDSTLRGHYPVETDVMAAELGPFDAHFLTPAFFEGGRQTVQSVHYLLVEGERRPVHLTEFAKDSVFGYTHSYLPKYVEEKTGGRIAAPQVERIVLEDLRSAEGCLARLLGLTGNACGVVDSETQSDMDAFARDVLAATAQGKRFLFRSAASLLTSLAGLGPQPLPPDRMCEYARGGRPGAIICGSHVRLSTQQLTELLRDPSVMAIELPIGRCATDEPLDQVAAEVATAAATAIAAGRTAVVFTPREEVVCDAPNLRLAFGGRVSALLVDVVRRLPLELGFLISKGGITSNDVLSQGLGLTTCHLLGQLLPGCSMVQTPADHPRFPSLPVLIFPGNVGGPEALRLAYLHLAGRPP